MTIARSPSQAQWESRYAADGYLYGTAPSPFLAACRPLLPARGRALSVADGEGRNGTFLAAAGLDVVSLDFSAAAQAKARALAAARGVSLTTVHADLLTWDWPDAAFDVVVGCFFQFLAPDERTLIFARLRAALKPGGWLLIEGFGVFLVEIGAVRIQVQQQATDGGLHQLLVVDRIHIGGAHRVVDGDVAADLFQRNP